MTLHVRPTVIAAGLCLALSLYAPAQQQGQKETPSGSTASQQTGRTDAASSSRNRLEEPKSMVGPAEQRFMNEAAAANLAEIQMARTAATKAQSDAVKQLAQRIEQDHSAANKELEVIANKRGVSLPTEPDPKHKAQMDKLAKLEGAAFDRAYARHMVSEHKKDISKFERASRNLMDTELRKFAESTLPKLREHLQMAQAAAGQKTSAAKTSD
jgi:putative membrane protein